jgi:hypothetical protein
MPRKLTVELSEESHRRIEAFQAVANAVLEEELDSETCLNLVIECALESMLRDLLGPQAQATLLKSIQQLAVREPAAVFGYVAEMLRVGAIVRKRDNQGSCIGFFRALVTASTYGEEPFLVPRDSIHRPSLHARRRARPCAK